jgi:hypothetical protein
VSTVAGGNLFAPRRAHPGGRDRARGARAGGGGVGAPGPRSRGWGVPGASRRRGGEVVGGEEGSRETGGWCWCGGPKGLASFFCIVSRNATMNFLAALKTWTRSTSFTKKQDRFFCIVSRCTLLPPSFLFFCTVQDYVRQRRLLL